MKAEFKRIVKFWLVPVLFSALAITLNSSALAAVVVVFQVLCMNLIVADKRPNCKEPDCHFVTDMAFGVGMTVAFAMAGFTATAISTAAMTIVDLTFRSEVKQPVEQSSEESQCNDESKSY